MLKIYLENGNTLIFEENGKKVSIIRQPNILSENDKVYLYYNAGTARYYEAWKYYYDIEVEGIIYGTASETVGAIGDLCAVFNAGGGGGGIICPQIGVPEAPKDGEMYGRKDGDWEKVEIGTILDAKDVRMDKAVPASETVYTMVTNLHGIVGDSNDYTALGLKLTSEGHLI